MSAQGVDGKRPTSADPYLQQYYGLSDSDLLEIRRERAIELLLEGFRYDDLMRWHAGELLNKQWYGIYIPAMDTSYDLNGDGINDVCVTSGEAGNEPGVTYIILDNSKYSLENGTTGRLLYTVGRNFEEKRYLRPHPQDGTEHQPRPGTKLLLEINREETCPGAIFSRGAHPDTNLNSAYNETIHIYHRRAHCPDLFRVFE